MSKNNTNRLVAIDIAKIIGIGALLGLVGAIVGSVFGFSSAVTIPVACATTGVLAGAIINRRNSGRQ